MPIDHFTLLPESPGGTVPPEWQQLGQAELAELEELVEALARVACTDPPGKRLPGSRPRLQEVPHGPPLGNVPTPQVATESPNLKPWALLKATAATCGMSPGGAMTGLAQGLPAAAHGWL